MEKQTVERDFGFIGPKDGDAPVRYGGDGGWIGGTDQIKGWGG